MNSTNRKNLLILSFTLLVVMVGYSLAMPLLPFYIELFGVGGTELGWLMSTYSLMQLICAPIWGILSDRYGRKPILAIGVLGYTISLFLIGLAPNFLMLFHVRSLSGILSSATMPTAMAYVGESTEQKEKARAWDNSARWRASVSSSDPWSVDGSRPTRSPCLSSSDRDSPPSPSCW